ncbi:hypothetical protein bcgnr5372_37630 [Bacillus luti]
MIIITIVHIRWSKLCKLSEIHNHEHAYSKGIYAIYRVYSGNETLLYIGKTKRNFQKRLSEHHKDWICDAKGIQVRLGILEFPDGERYSENKLADVESLLIHWQEPPENTSSINFYRGRDILEVVNLGNRGALRRRISTKKFDDW